MPCAFAVSCPPPVPIMRAVVRRSAAIIQNQWYDAWTGLACAAGAGSVMTLVRMLSLSIDQAVAGETIEVRLICDDLDDTMSIAAVAGTNYMVGASDSPDTTAGFVISSTATAAYRAFLLEGRSVQVMYRKTTAVGANATTIKIVYGQW